MEKGGPRSFTHVWKLGSNTRRSNELLMEKSLKEAPHCFGLSLRDFVDNSNIQDGMNKHADFLSKAYREY